MAIYKAASFKCSPHLNVERPRVDSHSDMCLYIKIRCYFGSRRRSHVPTIPYRSPNPQDQPANSAPSPSRGVCVL